MAKPDGGKDSLLIGVDIGGTKIQATLATPVGKKVKSQRVSTPREGGPEQVVAAILEAVNEVLKAEKLKPADIQGVGVGVPGVTDFRRGEVIVTPNMPLGRFPLGPFLQRQLGVPVYVENDCNLGTLGECWIGAGAGARSAFGIFVGTGIGGGFVRKRKIWRGARMAAGEVGHIVMQVGGPVCGCGNSGCLEALASRSAIERDIRQAIQAGRESVVREWLEQGTAVLRSKLLRNALEAGDSVVREVMQRAAEYIGYACLTVRHLLDPEVIILGGGVMEACGEFLFPVIQDIVAQDKLPGAGPSRGVVPSVLGDDAVVMGAVALAAQQLGMKPFRQARLAQPIYPTLEVPEFGIVRAGGKTYSSDIYILADGRVRKRKKKLLKKFAGSSHLVTVDEVRHVCQPKPEVLFVGLGHSSQMVLEPGVEEFLASSGITCHQLPTPKLPGAFNACSQKKAAIVHVTC